MLRQPTAGAQTAKTWDQRACCIQLMSCTYTQRFKILKSALFRVQWILFVRRKGHRIVRSLFEIFLIHLVQSAQHHPCKTEEWNGSTCCFLSFFSRWSLQWQSRETSRVGQVWFPLIFASNLAPCPWNKTTWYGGYNFFVVECVKIRSNKHRVHRDGVVNSLPMSKVESCHVADHRIVGRPAETHSMKCR